MNALDTISKADLKELLNKGWMTHDGMWFFHASRELDMETTNRLNRSAVASLAFFEVQRIREVLGMEGPIRNMEELKRFLEGAMDLILPKFMRFSYEFVEPGILRYHWEEGQCFAYKGVKRMGLLDSYQCGVMYRIDHWLQNLGVSYTGPDVKTCRMHSRGRCEGEYRFHLPS